MCVSNSTSYYSPKQVARAVFVSESTKQDQKVSQSPRLAWHNLNPPNKKLVVGYIRQQICEQYCCCYYVQPVVTVMNSCVAVRHVTTGRPFTLLCCCHREPAINSLTADPIFNITSLLLAGQITDLSCSDLLSVNIILGNVSNTYRELYHGILCLISIQLYKTTH